jgi:hypothetical protein
MDQTTPQEQPVTPGQLHVLTDRATYPWAEGGDLEAQRWGKGGYVAEHRYAMDLLAGLRHRGLRVQVVA